MPKMDMAETAKKMYFCNLKKVVHYLKIRYIYLPELSLPN